MNPRRSLTVLVVAAMALGVSCGGDSDTSGDNGDDSDDTLRDAEDIEAEQTAADAGRARLGEEFKLSELAITVDSITVVEEPDSTDRPFLVVHVRAENPGSKEASNPEIGIVCAGSEESGDGLAYSTFQPYEALPAGSFRDGFAWLTGPGDPRTGEQPTDCAGPAYLRVKSMFSDEVRVVLDDAVVGALNDEGCFAAGGAQLAEATFIANPVVCASFGDGPRPDTQG